MDLIFHPPLSYVLNMHTYIHTYIHTIPTLHWTCVGECIVAIVLFVKGTHYQTLDTEVVGGGGGGAISRLFFFFFFFFFFLFLDDSK